MEITRKTKFNIGDVVWFEDLSYDRKHPELEICSDKIIKIVIDVIGSEFNKEVPVIGTYYGLSKTPGRILPEMRLFSTKDDLENFISKHQK